MNQNSNIKKNNKSIFSSIYKNLLLNYPKVEVKPEDIIYHLSSGSENYKQAWLIISLTMFCGLLVYIIPIYLTEKDHIGPYPLWLHNFYCAADFMGIWIFLEAYKKHHFFFFCYFIIG